MSYNTRRGNMAFNKNMSSSNVGQRRPIVTNNFVQQQKQSIPQRQQSFNSSSHQQLDKQNQMFAQKKQQMPQQQRPQQQKQQMVTQKQQVVNKQLEHLAQQKKELDIKKQRDLEIQKQKDLEQQKQMELKQEKQKELELQKEKELELQKQITLEQEKQKMLDQEMKIKLEQEEKINLEQEEKINMEKLKQAELEAQKQQMLEQQNQIDSVRCESKQLKYGQIKEQIYQIHSEVDIPKHEESENMIIENQDSTNPLSNELIENVEGNKSKRKRWSARRKLSKYEIQRRRNFKLSKLLQPKNAMAVLNEIVKNVTYSIDDSKNNENFLYRATAVVDGVEHEGFAASKIAAKNTAAEKALKHLVKTKKLMQVPKSMSNKTNQSETEAMDTTDNEENDMPLAWQQFASFAVYKLLASWGENPNCIREETTVNKKPSKKIPENAHLMHPLMLLNQMMPHLHFEEMPRSTDGHNSTNVYTFKCTVDGQIYVGSGTSKKSAKKQAAFEICRTILGIEYPPELYTPPVPTSA